MGRIIPYLKFEEAKCAEAMEFYHSVFGGQLDIQKVGDSPAAEHMPAETHDSVMHAALWNDSFSLYGSDMVDENGAKPGFGVGISFVGKADEVKVAWAKMAEGGKITHDLREEFFGTYGDLVDKYGFYWMFQADAPKQA
jgi:PhnB protein